MPGLATIGGAGLPGREYEPELHGPSNGPHVTRHTAMAVGGTLPMVSQEPAAGWTRGAASAERSCYAIGTTAQHPG